MKLEPIAKGPEYLRTRDAATYLGVSPQFLEIGRSRGFGPRFVKIGRIVRYRRIALDRWMSLHEHRPT
jgi:predicted DNA-binding transcriptional regulator AlpA